MAFTLKPQETIVLKSATFSRFILLTLILIWRTLVSPYDTSAPLNPDCLTNTNPDPDPSLRTVRWPGLSSSIENGIVWDSVYFVRIAQCGYEYEQTYAFLPLLPVCISFFSRTVFAPLIPLVGERAVLALSGYVINNVAFVFAALYFYRLSVIILKDPNAALRASVLFCFNPASIFYSSIYSESLYSLLSIGGLYHLASDRKNIAVLCLALSGCARSNGVLNAGYLCFQMMHQAYDAALRKKHWIVTAGALRGVCIFAPFIAFQAYGYYNICLGHLSNEMRPWCKTTVPVLYNFIQGHYWGVGFLRYFQLKQLPNFLLASPILSMVLFSIIHYAKSRPQVFFSLGFQATIEEKISGCLILSSDDFSRSDNACTVEKSSSRMQGVSSNQNFPIGHNLKQRKKRIIEGSPDVIPLEYESTRAHGYLSASVLPFVLHLGFMAATAFFVVHVQVATRFLSAGPPLYWFSSYLMISPTTSRKWGYMIWVYSAAYILLGSLLFSNFYPFT
ncbi:GPI mannosyltransferase 2 [Quillaja saponaria]|uniref:GPI mannosyltransferase 2 n=1 Tax=Quillaja saponaria TaxID=32244 RepID=A0AAD7QGS3_QUISA|nr:GPI mannosyltransferase 2 [Quillaja saponaria]